MKRSSLRLRLLIGGAVAIAVALTIAWVAMGFLFTRHIERQAELDLQRIGLEVVAGVTDVSGKLVMEPAPR
ncbi:MAG: sensor histidine kinase, partial [Pseudomonadota bacterium]